MFKVKVKTSLCVCVCACVCVYVRACSCIFVWRLSPQLTIRMRQRQADLRPLQPLLTPRSGSAPRVLTLSSNSDKEEEEEEPCSTPAHSGLVGEGLVLPSGPPCGRLQEPAGARTARRRWSSRGTGSEDELLMVKSMLDLRMLEEDEQLQVATLHPALTHPRPDGCPAPPRWEVPPSAAAAVPEG